MRTASYDMLTQSVHANAEAWASIGDEYPNVKIKTFPDEIFEAMVAANKKVLKERAYLNTMAELEE